MKITIFSQYQHLMIARALRKALATFGVHCDLKRLSSTLNEEMGDLESDACLLLLPPYWEIQSSFILPLFTLITRAETFIHQRLSKTPTEDRVPAKQRSSRKCLAVSVGAAPFVRPSLSLNLAEILTALWGRSRHLELGVAQLDGNALLDVVEPVTAVVRHCREPSLWADYLMLLISLRDSEAFKDIQMTVRTSLASSANEKMIVKVAEILDVGSREMVVKTFFPPEASA